MRKATIIVCWLVSVFATAQVQQAQPDTELNDLRQLGWQVQHSSLSFDKRSIVFSAKKPNENNYNIYFARKSGTKWGNPSPLTAVNTEEDEYWPSLSSDENQVYFVRNENILVTTRTNGVWDKGQTIIISEGHDISPLIMPDNQTLLFASRRKIEDKKEQTYSIYYSRKVGKYDWYIPELIFTSYEKGTNLYGISLITNELGQVLRFTKQVCTRKDTTYTTEYLTLFEKYHAQPVLTLTGSVKDADTERFMANTIIVYDAITSQQITTLTNEGRFMIALPVGQKYLLDITSTNYSHTYLEYDCTHLTADSSDVHYVKLAKQLNIHVNIFDAETQLPVSHVQCTPHNLVRTSTKGADITLPIGNVYTIHFSKKGYFGHDLVINTRKDVLLPYSELDIDLEPGKAPLKLVLYDRDTRKPISGTVRLNNRQRAEALTYSDSTRLRQGEQYALNATAAGYLYYDTLINVPYTEAVQRYEIGLRKIEQQMIMQLRNIQFEYNSASLLDSSREELEKVIQLLNENPSLSIELHAHTDDHGTDAYNDKLSERRGEVVLKYLVKHGISPERLSSIGFGKRQPLVPNDSDENRAINRRVEFKVLGI